ncbi:MAG: imidazole glycerol phosphate synthase subunit HisF [Candidatus Thorarchaeota archaeon]
MLCKRIIPCLDIKDGAVVKGVEFRHLRTIGDPVELARSYAQQGADELAFLDISASRESRATMTDLVRRVAVELDIPFTVGGGVSSLETALSVLSNGADKVAINTAAVRDPSLIRRIADVFGSQSVVVAVDALRHPTSLGHAPWWEVFVLGGHEPTGLDAIDWCIQAAGLGAGEILLTSIGSDGSRSGYDLTLTREVTRNVGVPVIASGGAGSPRDIFDVLTIGGADAALAASIFHLREYDICEVKSYLLSMGVPVRPCH